MKLITDLIPHEKFHKGIWLSNEKVPWYFFIEIDRKYELPKNKDFYGSVDLQLLPIVKMLHKHKIPTTPSCAGHFEDEDYYSDIYDMLDEFGKNFKKGVILQDDEDNRKFSYKNENYKLPWDKDEFIDKIVKYQKNGAIGFYDKDGEIYKNLEDNNTKKIKDGDITIVKIKSKNFNDMEDKWKNIHNQIKEILS